jgi:hypothetical protein
MLESASVLSFYLAFALLHGADAARYPLKGARPSRQLLRCMKGASPLAAALGTALWAEADSARAALLVAPTALSAVATVFVLLAPVAPRVLWGLALACPPLILALALGGA